MDKINQILAHTFNLSKEEVLKNENDMIGVFHYQKCTNKIDQISTEIFKENLQSVMLSK